jgi:hypothetical protein
MAAVCLFCGLVHRVLARRPDLTECAKRPTFFRPLQRLLAAGYRGSPAQRECRSPPCFLPGDRQKG